jgi:hypothetical protein
MSEVQSLALTSPSTRFKAKFMADEIEFITITTGATRLSRRTEIPGIAVDEVRAAIAEGRRLLDTGWSVRLRHAPDGCFAYSLVYDGQPVIACYLCVDRAQSDDLWTIASLAPNLLGRSMAPKPTHVPWLASVLAPSDVIARDPLLLASLVREALDIERCVAWALIE